MLFNFLIFIRFIYKVSLQTPNCLWQGLINHELVHVLGFWHEQSRLDRDKHIRILYENILPDAIFNFKKYSTIVEKLNFKYDYDSIMHYDTTTFSKNGLPTILPIKPGIDLKKNAFKLLSSIDIQKIRSYYNCQ